MMEEVPYQIRFARVEEWEDAMGLAWKTFLEFEAEEYGPVGIRNFEDFITDNALKRMFVMGKYQMIVAYAADKMVGMITLRNEMHISLLFVDKQFHRRGIGRALIRSMADYVRDEIGKERIRRAGTEIKNENGLNAMNLDVGFRVLKCDTSNMKEVFYKPDEVEQTLFDNFANNIKEDRTAEDLLFQVMLDLGVMLSSTIEETEINGCKVFNVADGFLYACFDENISDDVVKAIANEQPYYAVFRDSGMASDSVMTNFDQIFASISPSTVRKVL